MAILVVATRDFILLGSTNSFGFDNRKIAAKLPTPRRKGTGKIKQEPSYFLKLVESIRMECSIVRNLK
jgi:hypothetical protein